MGKSNPKWQFLGTSDIITLISTINDTKGLTVPWGCSNGGGQAAWNTTQIAVLDDEQQISVPSEQGAALFTQADTCSASITSQQQVCWSLGRAHAILHAD